MAKIGELLAGGFTVSFEFFPPKTDEAQATLVRTLRDLEPLQPSFVSVTYGAGGSTRQRTNDLVVGLRNTTLLTPMAHLTCVGHTRTELVDIVQRYKDSGVENILALGGDVPDGAEPTESDLQHASDLVELVQDIGGFSIGVAAHPEGHPRSASIEADREQLARKLSAADFAITQFFFEVEPYVELVEDMARRGVTAPIVPGIMPVTNVSQVERMAKLSGVAMPAAMAEKFHSVGDDPAAVRALGVDLATKLCEGLRAAGAPGLHFYTLNRSTATREIAGRLGLATAASSDG
jgi:methylenetetrahydrofolate reductase (NADPH)